MTLRWLLENVKGADYIVIETKEKELNPFTDEIEGEHKVLLDFPCSKIEECEYLDKEIEEVHLDYTDCYDDFTEVGFYVRLKE